MNPNCSHWRGADEERTVSVFYLSSTIPALHKPKQYSSPILHCSFSIIWSNTTPVSGDQCAIAWEGGIGNRVFRPRTRAGRLIENPNRATLYPRWLSRPADLRNIYGVLAWLSAQRRQDSRAPCMQSLALRFCGDKALVRSEVTETDHAAFCDWRIALRRWCFRFATRVLVSVPNRSESPCHWSVMILDVGDSVQLPVLITKFRALEPNTRRQGVLDRWSESVDQLTTISPLCWQSR